MFHSSYLRAFAVTAIIVAALAVAAGSASAQSIFTSQTPEFSQNVKPVLFPFNVSNRVVDPGALSATAEWLKQHPDTHFWIQGRADNRGDIVYNLVLAYRRAQFVKNSLIKKGVNDSQIGFATGWGKLYPVCEQNDDSCWQDNRRVDIVQPDHAL